jgi:hypothetical protein
MQPGGSFSSRSDSGTPWRFTALAPQPVRSAIQASVLLSPRLTGPHDVLVVDATAISTLSGVTDSLKRFWLNISR